MASPNRSFRSIERFYIFSDLWEPQAALQSIFVKRHARVTGWMAPIIRYAEIQAMRVNFYAPSP